LLLGFIGVVSDANPTGGIKARDNAAFGVQPQGFGRIGRNKRLSFRSRTGRADSNFVTSGGTFDPSASNRKAALKS